MNFLYQKPMERLERLDNWQTKRIEKLEKELADFKADTTRLDRVDQELADLRAAT